MLDDDVDSFSLWQDPSVGEYVLKGPWPFTGMLTGRVFGCVFWGSSFNWGDGLLFGGSVVLWGFTWWQYRRRLRLVRRMREVEVVGRLRWEGAVELMALGEDLMALGEDEDVVFVPLEGVDDV